MNAPSPTTHALLAGLLTLLALAAACSDPEEAPTVSTAACRLNSDCSILERCDEGACVPRDTACEADCPCVTDTDCSNEQRCHRPTGTCVPRECQQDTDCPLGALCLQGQCLTDLNADRDRDGLPDLEDSCPGDPNPQDDDTDSDGRGDVCDLDDDGDGVDDDDDNCPLRPNPDQRDDDANGRGDACEGDLDSDGVLDDDDNCPQTSNPDQRDSDALLPNGEPDPDADGLGDACDEDDDGDAVPDRGDNCRLHANPDQADADGNGTGDRCEPDLQGACGACGVDRVEGSALFCRNPCDNAVVCTPGSARCNEGARQSCDTRGHWEDSPCAPGQFCVERLAEGVTQAACSSQLCTPGARRCLDGVTIEVCNEQGDAWRIDTLCPDTLLCQPAEDGAFACLDCATRCAHLLNALPHCGPDGRGACALARCLPGAASCDGDPGNGCEAAQNSCGGCAILTAVPGQRCGSCESGLLSCDGPDALTCVGDRGESALNACGGCAALEGSPGDPCGSCERGQLACLTADALGCEGDPGPDALNACGGCAPLAFAPGTPCGPCDLGQFVCEGADSTLCHPVCGERCDDDAACGPQARCTAGRCAPPGLAIVPPGTSRIGSVEGEPGRDPGDEQLQSVELSWGLLVQRAEVTQRSWYARMFGAHPFAFDRCVNGQPTCESDLPAENVTWFQALAFANRLSEHEGLERCYKDPDVPARDYDLSNANARKTPLWPAGLACAGWRLPTEAEWERASRGGAETAFFSGPVFNPEGPDPNLDPIGWYASNSQSMTWPVALKTPNPFGLYDTHGNVAEWTWDRYASATPTGIDPTGPDTGATRVLRGGAWDSTPALCRAAARDSAAPDTAAPSIGLRLVRSILLCACPDACEVLTECDEGCFDLNTDVDHCGGCGISCRRPDRPGPACLQGTCDPGPCAEGLWDIDGDDTNGCEYACTPSAGGQEICDSLDNNCDGQIDEGFDLYGDTENCGACGYTCRFDNAGALCIGGQCELGTCGDLHYDEDGLATTGCERYVPGGVLYVDDDATGTGDGSASAPFPTIQAALDVAAPGDIVDVAPGFYSEDLTINPDHVTVRGAGAALTRLQCGFTPTSDTCVDLNAPWSRVQGITIEALASNVGVAINPGCTIGCQLTDARISDLYVPQSSTSLRGVRIQGASRTRIVNVVIEDLVTPSSHTTAQSVSGIRYDGRSNDATGGEIVQVTIRNLQSRRAQTYGIEYLNHPGGRIVGLTMLALTASSGLVGVQDLTDGSMDHAILQGFSTSPVCTGIQISRSTIAHVAILDLTSHNSSVGAIRVRDGLSSISNLTLYNVDTLSAGIEVGESNQLPAQATITATHIEGFQAGITASCQSCTTLLSWSTFRDVDYPTQAYVDTGDGVTTIPLQRSSGLADPLNGDPRLLDGSPLIDAANPAASCAREPTSPTGSCRLDIGNYGNTPRARAAP